MAREDGLDSLEDWIETRAQYEHLGSRLWTERFILDAGIRWFLGLWA
jgi:hypothetical protein